MSSELKFLYDGAMPVSVAQVPSRLHASQFSRLTPNGYNFGCDAESAAKRLRELADDPERKTVLLQSIEVRTVSMADDFPSTELKLVVVEKGRVEL
jgi:hypothetical protein